MQYENVEQNIKSLWKLLNPVYHVEGRFHQMMLQIELNGGNTRQFLKNNIGTSQSSCLNLQPNMYRLTGRTWQRKTTTLQISLSAHPC